jgi:hypothetical protein
MRICIKSRLFPSRTGDPRWISSMKVVTGLSTSSVLWGDGRELL